VLELLDDVGRQICRGESVLGDLTGNATEISDGTHRAESIRPRAVSHWEESMFAEASGSGHVLLTESS
jgi:hypothetical protein